MRSLLPRLALASAAIAMAAVPAKADVSVNVPFTFTVHGTQCPAGRYQVARNMSSNMVSLQSDDRSCHFAWAAGSGDPSPEDPRVVLRFDETGDMHQLQSVQFGSVITQRLDRTPRTTD